MLHIVGGGIQIDSNDNTSDFVSYSYGTSVKSDFDMRRARGTKGSASILSDNDNLGQINWVGYDDDSFEPTASIRAYVDGTPGDEIMPSRLEFYTTPTGSDTWESRMIIDNQGYVGIGTTDPSYMLNVMLSDNAGTDEFRVTDSDGVSVFNVDSNGNIVFGVDYTSTMNFNNTNITSVNTFQIADTGSTEGYCFPGGCTTQGMSVYTAAQGGYDAYVFNTTASFPYVFNTGNVGIGTTDPGVQFQVEEGVRLAYQAGDNVTLFENAAAGENPHLYIYGDNSGTPEYTRLSISTSGYFDIESQNAIVISQDGQANTHFFNGGYFRSQDQRYIAVGSNNDGIMSYDETTNDAWEIGVPTSNRFFVMQRADVNTVTDLSSLGDYSDINLGVIDSDLDSIIQLGYQNDDIAELWSNRDIVLQSAGGNVGIGTTAPGYTLDIDAGTSTRAINTTITDPSSVSYALYNSIDISSANVFGTRTDFTVDDSANAYGNYNDFNLSGGATTASALYGVYNDLSTTTEESYFYGVYNNVSGGDGQTGSRFVGLLNDLDTWDANTAQIEGVYNEFTNIDATDAWIYGIHNQTVGFIAAGTTAFGMDTGFTMNGTDSVGYGIRTSLSSLGADSTGQTLYGEDISITAGGGGDTAYGLRVTDGNSTGGTVYGSYIDIDDATSTNYSLYVESGSGESYFGSNVGIGTTAPDTALHLSDSTADLNYILTIENSTLGGEFIEAINDSGNTIFEVDADSSGDGLIFIRDSSGNGDIRLHSNSNSYFLGGNVGIGKTAPSELFEVYNTTNMGGMSLDRDGTSTETKFYFKTAGNDQWNFGLEDGGSDDDLHLWNYGSSSFAMSWQHTTGNIGIGATNPGSALDIYRDADNVLLIDSYAAGGGTYESILAFRNDGTGSNYWKAGVDETGYYAIGYDTDMTETSGEVLTITTDGEVGIGTTNPSYELDVVGDINVQSTVVVTESFEGSFPPTGWTTGGDANWTQDSGDYYSGSYSAVSGNISDDEASWIDRDYTFANDGVIRFYWKVSSEYDWDYLLFCIDNDSCTTLSGYAARISGTEDWTQMTFPISAGAHSFRWVYDKDPGTSSGTDEGWIDLVTFEEGGMVKAPAIDTDTITNSSGVSINFNVGDYTGLHVDTNGNVGVGSLDPTYALDVVGNVGIGTAGVGQIYSNNDTNTYFGFAAYDDFRINVGGSQALRMDEGTEDDLLYGATWNAIYGTNTFYIGGSSGSYSGNIGIGTTAPAEALDVEGEIEFDIDTANDTTIGVCKDLADGNTDVEFRECSSTPGDIAEYYEAEADLRPGDVVMMYDNAGTMQARKASMEYDPKSFSVVSTYPVGQFGKPLSHDTIADDEFPTAMALIGKVPVRVSTANGDIAVGDPLTTSSIPGVAMKATKPGRILGYATESFNATTTVSNGVREQEWMRSSAVMKFNLDPIDPVNPDEGKIIMLVNPSWYEPESYLEKVNQIIADYDAGILVNEGTIDTLTNLTITDTLTANAIQSTDGIFSTITVDNMAVNNDLAVNGVLTTQELRTNVLTAMDPVSMVIKLADNIGDTSLEIHNSDDEAVLSVDSTGHMAVRADPDAPSIGTGTIPANNKFVEIYTGKVMQESKVFITATISTDKMIAVTQKVDASHFVVEISENVPYDVTFDWWIIGDIPVPDPDPPPP